MNAFLLQLLDEIGPYGDLLGIAERKAPAELRPGVDFLLNPPPDISPATIHDGGHRTLAMKEQGERWTVGCSFVCK